MKVACKSRRAGQWTVAGLLIVVIFLAAAYDIDLILSPPEEVSGDTAQIHHPSPGPTAPLEPISSRFSNSFKMQQLGMNFTPGDSAPEISLPAVSGDATLRLERSDGCKPHVLIFGNFTCDRFQVQLAELESFYRSHKDRAVFAFIAVNEAGHHIPGFEFLLQELPSEKPFEVRKVRVRKALDLAGLTIPAFIDLPDQRVSDSYRGWPARLLVVDAHGKIVRDFGSVVRDGWNWEQIGQVLESGGTNAVSIQDSH
jgi:Iodothyronine deiodinase